jgi:hypothetical protein
MFDHHLFVITFGERQMSDDMQIMSDRQIISDIQMISDIDDKLFRAFRENRVQRCESLLLDYRTIVAPVVVVSWC